MPRSSRFLSSNTTTTSSSSSSNQTAAEPPEAVAVESDFIVILAALLCALICVLGLFSVARCAFLRRGSTSNTRRNNPNLTSAANKGIKKKIVETLPKFVYNNEQNDAVRLSDCAICLTEYSDGDEIRVLPQCGHGFHVGCIDTWLGSHSSCPSCRQILAVSRCRKCGEFPAVKVSGSVSCSMSAERKGGPHDDDNHNNSACNSSNNYLP